MKSKIKIRQYAVRYANYGATLNLLECLLVRRMFLSSDNLNHEQKPQTAPEKLNKETPELMKKFYQIILLNDANQNTVSCDYYDLNDFNKVIVTK